jgi:hypothetical protein
LQPLPSPCEVIMKMVVLLLPMFFSVILPLPLLLLLQAAYPLLVMAAGCVELLGGVLFTFNQPLGAALLVCGVPCSAMQHTSP